MLAEGRKRTVRRTFPEVKRREVRTPVSVFEALMLMLTFATLIVAIMHDKKK
ncbi:MAG: putative holin-like toxin [Oscillospiraceae bacterium]|jgi:hypothetical protein|nr:putative holin-like toxin [Oscillospiraceae bacterium]